MNVRATPFHGRTSALNRFNRWTIRNGFTLPLDFGDAPVEALAARTRVVMADISWRSRVLLEGPTVADMVAWVFTRDPRALTPGQSLKAIWLNDGGAVRGAGVVCRLASDKFIVASAADDFGWFERVAALSGNSAHDVTDDEGGLALIGPYAARVLAVAGLPSDVACLELRKQFWRGLDVTITCWGEQNGYELWCKAGDCTILWDRITRAGADFNIQPAGVAASDVLDIEASVPRPNRDYLAGNDGFASDPTPDALGLTKLIDTEHPIFNGHGAWLSNRDKRATGIAGLELDSEIPASFCPLEVGDKVVGTTLTSVYSPFLRRAIALARIDKTAIKDGASFALVLPATLENSEPKAITAHLREFPFVEPPSMIEE